MVREAPQMCAAHATACCASCGPTTTTTTTTPAMTTDQLKTSSVTANNQTGNYSLILGLAVGIPFFVLLLVFTILLCICCKSHKQQKIKTKDTEEDHERPVPTDENFFNSYVAKGYNCYGGKHFQTFRGYRDNGSFESPENIERTSYLGNKSNCSGQSKHSFIGYLPKGQRNSYSTNGQNHNGRLSHI